MGNVPQKVGRDLVSKAEYYVVLNRSKTLIVISPVVILKNRVQEALRVIDVKARGIIYKNSGLEIRTTLDPHDGTLKMMGFIPFDSIEAIKKIEVDPKFFIVEA